MKQLRLVASLLLMTAAHAVAAQGPSEDEVKTAVQTELRASAAEQIDYMRKNGGEDSVRLAREMGTLVEPDDIKVSNLEVDEVQETDAGDYDARTRFDLAMGENHDKVNARIRLRGEPGAWQVIKLEKY